MTQDRKFFGMTKAQLAILGGLAAVVCLLFGVAGILILRGGLSRPAPTPQNTPLPPLTATPFVLPTLTLTETPTPVPYELLIPEGWLQFKTALVEIWLPKEFKQKKAIDDPEDPATLELQMEWLTSKSAPFPVTVMVFYEPWAAGSLDTYVDNVAAKLTPGTRLTDRRKVTINSVDAMRLSMEARYESLDLASVNYLFLDGNTVWIVQYLAQINDFYTMLDMFEKSVRTFRPVR